MICAPHCLNTRDSYFSHSYKLLILSKTCFPNGESVTARQHEIIDVNQAQSMNDTVFISESPQTGFHDGFLTCQVSKISRNTVVPSSWRVRANLHRRGSVEANHHRRRREEVRGADHPPVRWEEFILMSFHIVLKKGNGRTTQRRQRKAALPKEALPRGGGGRQNHQKEEGIAAMGRSSPLFMAGAAFLFSLWVEREEVLLLGGAASLPPPLGQWCFPLHPLAGAAFHTRPSTPTHNRITPTTQHPTP